MNKGFTLIELLVVVLIIGILSSVALPSYTKSVEKARLSEALVNSKAILDSARRYVDMYPEDGGVALTKDKIADVELKGGSWSGSTYTTKLFTYTLGNAPDGTDKTVVTVVRKQNGTTLYEFTVNEKNKKTLKNTSTAIQANINALLTELNPPS